jgi:hypothetical protein
MVYCRNRHQRCHLIKYIFVNIFSKNNKVFDIKNIKLAILIKNIGVQKPISKNGELSENP